MVLHHALKDVRQFRWRIALWVAMLVLDSTLQSLRVDGHLGDPQAEWCLEALAALGYALAVVGCLLAGGIVQADSLDNPSAFWLTRPVSRARLLAGKLLVVVPLFLVLPVAAATLIAWSNGAEGGRLVLFAVERLVVDAALLTPVLVAASVTHNLARMVLALAAALPVYIGIQLLAMMPLPWVVRSTQVRAVGLLVALALSIGLGLALLAHQYITRATRRTRALALAAVALIVVAGNVWPFGLRLVTRAAVTSAADFAATQFDPSSVTLVLEGHTLRRSPPNAARVDRTSLQYPAAAGSSVDVSGVLRAEGVRQGWVVRPLGGRTDVRVNGQVVPVSALSWTAGQTLPSGTFFALNDAVTALETALRARFPGRSGEFQGPRARLFRLPESAFGEPPSGGSLRLRIELQAERVLLSPPAPIVVGASTRLDGEEVTILATRGNLPGGFLTVRMSRPSVALAGELELFLVVRNRKTGEAFFPSMEEVHVGRAGLLPTDVAVRRASLSRELAWPRWFHDAQASRRSPMDVTSSWLADAELLLAAFEPVGRFSKTAELDEFRLPRLYYSN